jgi:ATP-binding cassette subfamily F protein uup
LSYKDQRDLDRLPGEIERIEADIAATERALADPQLFTGNPKRFTELTAKLEQLGRDKAAAEDRWLEVADLAEQLGA